MSEDSLKAQRALTEAITHSVAEGIYATDRAGRFTFVNPAALDLLGWSEAELIGRPAHDTIHSHHTDGTVFPVETCAILAVLESGTPLRNHRDAFVRKDGTTFPVSCSSAPILSEGTITGAVVAFADITEQKRAADELRAAYQRERRIAETLQRSLLMLPEPNALPRLGIETLYEPASDEARLGGDFYDVIALAGNRVALVVADICGQGLAAAVWSAEVKYALRAILHADGAPDGAMCRLNDYLVHAWRENSRTATVFVALSVIVVETETGQAQVSVGGIEPPLLLRANGETEMIAGSGLPLGIATGEAYSVRTVMLRPGDTLIQVTDGITEARPPRRVPRTMSERPLLGYEGLIRLAQAASGDRTLHALGRSILDGAHAFAEGPLGDDACVLLARWH